MSEASIELRAGDAELRDALSEANLPTLLLVLAQMTGDPLWLEDPYRPSRTVAMDDNDSGGFPPEIQEEIRAAALEILRDYRDGRIGVSDPPSPGDLIAMLSVSLGESVPSEYGTVMSEEAGWRPRQDGWTGGTAPEAAARFHVVIIGAGISGLSAARACQRLGIPYTVIERDDDVGGTWWVNDYPGAACDTPSHLYSYSFAPNRSWTRYYAKQGEILAYLQQCAREFGVLPHIRFRTEVVSAAYDERARVWQVDLRARGGDGEARTGRVVGNVLISAVGQMNEPNVPSYPGLDRFRKPAFHSARWRHDVDLTGKRVGVVGTGASAMQVVPAVAGRAAEVLVFQRSPQWVIPNPNYLRSVDERVRLLMEQVPYYATWYRLRLIHMFQDKLHATLQKDPDWPHPERAVNAVNDRHRQFFLRHIENEIAGHEPKLAAKVVPTYPPYGKRMLMDNNWFKTLTRDDVELVAEGVSAFDEDAVVTADGARHDVDVVVLATGFRSRRMLFPMDIRGRNGISLRDVWGEDDASAYLGISVPGFPNFFLLYGPNTNLGHGGSTIFHTECQTGYIAQLLVRMIEDGIGALECRRDVHDDYLARVDAAHEGMIWTHPGMTNWYRNAKGRVVTNTPWRLVDYWAMTRTPNLGDFLLTRE